MTTTAQSPWWETDYPSQYYAYANDSVTLGGYPVAGWVDVSVYAAKPADLPVASDMVALTEYQWNARLLVNQVIKDGKVATWTPDVPVIPLTTQAPTS